MARELAAWGCDLVIAARRADRLEVLAAELGEAHGVDVTCVALDLTDPDAPARLEEAAYAGGEVDILINNAGFGARASFLDVPWERYDTMLALNVRAVVELTHRFSRRMLSRPDRPGRIGNASSLVAWAPVPRLAVYAATRSFVRDFTEAAALDLKGTNVSVTSVCFGAVDTEFNDVAGIRVGGVYKPFMMSAPRAARKALKGIWRRRRRMAVGGTNKVFAVLMALAPRRAVSGTISFLLGKPKPPALPGE